jgi:hypothetical protein
MKAKKQPEQTILYRVGASEVQAVEGRNITSTKMQGWYWRVVSVVSDVIVSSKPPVPRSTETLDVKLV